MQSSEETITPQFLVRGPNPKSTGHAFYFCGGYGWPGDWLPVAVKADIKEAFEREVLDRDSGKKSIIIMIGPKHLDELNADATNKNGSITIRPIDAGTGDGKEQAIKVPQLMEQIAALKMENETLKGDNAALKAKLREANSLLEQATKPAQELIRKVGNRRGG